MTNEISNDQVFHKLSSHLLPAKPGTCSECAVIHDPTYPHNQQSLYYQYHFYAGHNRWPTWWDAMSHCSKEMQNAWITELAKNGIKVERPEAK